MIESVETIRCVHENWPNSEIFEKIQSHQNEIISGQINGAPAIFRCTPSSHRSIAQIQDERNWMEYLRASGVRVPAIRLSKNNRAVESVRANGATAYVIALERIDGAALSSPGNLSNATAREWGRLIGQMNRASKEYPAADLLRWPGNETGIMALRQYLGKLGDVSAPLGESLEEIESRPRNRTTYGLIHCDCHADNVQVCKGDLYALDFDECCRHWRLMDVTNAIFSLYFDFATANHEIETFSRLGREILSGFASEFPEIATEFPYLRHFFNYRVGLLFAWSSGHVPAPRWMASASEEWKQFLRNWSADEIRSNRLCTQFANDRGLI